MREPSTAACSASRAIVVCSRVTGFASNRLSSPVEPSHTASPPGLESRSCIVPSRIHRVLSRSRASGSPMSGRGSGLVVMEKLPSDLTGQDYVNG